MGLAASLPACGSPKSAPVSFGDASAAFSHDAGDHHDVTAGDTGALPLCAPPDAGPFDAGAAITGLLAASVGGPGVGGLNVAFDATPRNSLSCIGPEVPSGSCCITMGYVIASSENLPTAGPVTLVQAGMMLATSSAVYGLYSSSTVDAWTPGAELTFSAPGARVPAFSLQVLAPGNITQASASQTGVGATRLSLGADLVVTWSPAPDASSVQVFVSQITGHESCRAPEMLGIFQVQPAAPLYIACNADSASGTLTVPEQLFAEAHFTPGEIGTVSVAAVNVDEVSVPASGGEDRVVAVASSPLYRAGNVTFLR